MAHERNLNYQTVAWFRDVWRRELLELDPPYQRRSVWNQSYKDYFVETVLLGYPSPAIFLHEQISASGSIRYSVVDGKQRLTTLFEFANGEFSVADDSVIERLRGQTFEDLPEDDRKAFHQYRMNVEYVDATDEVSLDDVFDRLNRNVARLSRQELRHARFSGEFASGVELLTEYLEDQLPRRFPRIADASRRQMKDIEFTSLLVLLLERGPTSTTQDELDTIYADRDDDWEEKHTTDAHFRSIVQQLAPIAYANDSIIGTTRLRNQGDFYALFGAVATLGDELPPPEMAAERLVRFMEVVGDESARELDPLAASYYEAARSAANDPAKRSARIEALCDVLINARN